MGLSDEELAAEFIRRAANALLKDECGVEGECEEPRSGRMTILYPWLLPTRGFLDCLMV